jgi:hypothetical protein
MWVIMSFLPSLWWSDKERTSWMLIVGLPVWALGGFAFGFLMWLFVARRPARGQPGESGAPPNGGRGTPSGNSGATEGPPSVS